MFGSQDILDDVHSSLECESLGWKVEIVRLNESVMKTSPDLYALEQGVGVVLGGDGAELLDEITGLPTAPLRVLTGQTANIHPVEYVRGRVERPSPFPRDPVLAQHLPLKTVQHRYTLVGGLLDHRRFGERRQREMRVLSGIKGIRVFNRRIRTRVLIRLSRVRVLFHQGVDPPCGHA